MADLRISQLGALDGADLASEDLLVAVDDSASETKKLTVGDLIANGVTLIADDTIPGAKILFAAGGIATSDIADGAITTDKLADDDVTAAKLADESTLDLVTTLPASGAFTGQLALDTDDNFLYVWDGSSWISLKAAGSINTVSGDTSGTINITTTTSGSTVTVAATIDDTSTANHFLAGPTGTGGTVGYRAIDSTDLPVASTTAKGAVLVNGEGLRMDGDTIEVDNDVTSTTTHHVVTYSAKGLITGGRALTSADLPLATSTDAGAVIPGDGLAVDVNGNLSIDNSVAAGTYTKVTVTAEGVVSTGDTLDADDIPDHSAAKLTSGTIGSSLIATGAVTATKLADESITQFGGAAGSDNVTIFPAGDFKGQFFYDETTQDLYIYTGSAFVPITVLSGNLVNAGAYNANTNLMSSVTSAGSSAGFSTGQALPAPSSVNLNHYVVVDTSGTGSGAAPAVALAPPDMLLSQGVGTEYSLIDVSNAIAGQTASNISLIATGDIVATDVQAAVTELDQEKLPKAGGTMTGDLTLNNVNIVFEGSTADDYETTLTVTDPTADRTITLPNVTGTVVTTGDTGSVTSTMITDGTIVNADINASAEIAVSKLANGTARQLLQTDAAGTGVEFTDNIDVPGTLDVSGAGTFDSTVDVANLLSANGKISFAAGDAATPGIYAGTDTDTGIYSPGADQVAISTNGTGRLFVDANGNVGLGISPTTRFHVYQSGSTQAGLIETNQSASVLNFKSTGQSSGQPQVGCASSDMILNTNAIERLRITSTGTVNIVGAGTAGTTQAVHFNGSAPVNSLVVNSSGSVGIGTSSPAQLLHVKGSGDVKLLLNSTNNASDRGIYFATGTDSEVLGYIKQEYSTGKFEISGGSGTYASSISFRTGGTADRVVINSSGNVGIGTTSPQSNLVISDSGANGIEFVPNIATNQNLILSYNRSTSARTALELDASEHLFTNGNSEYGRIDSSGRLLVGTSSWYTIPDHYFGNAWSQGQQIKITDSTGAYGGLAIISASDTANARIADISLNRQDGSTDYAALSNGNSIGSVTFNGADGSKFVRAASIRAEVDGTPGANDMPGRLVFSTTASTNSSPTERMRIAQDGKLTVPGVYSFTTADAANVRVTAAGDLVRSTSSLKYKTDVETLENTYADGILNCRPVWFRSLSAADNPSWGYWGFIAEEVAEIDPRLVSWKTTETTYDENGSAVQTACDPEPEGVQYDRFVPHLLNLIKRQKEQIETMEARLSALEAS